MATRGDVFPSKYLSAGDLLKFGEAGVRLVIDRVTFEEVGRNKDRRAILYFKGATKGLVMNKTNWTRVEQSTGQNDTDFWPGWAITLYPTKVQYGDEMVDSIRIKPGATPPAGQLQPVNTGAASANSTQGQGQFDPAGAFGSLDSATIPQQRASVSQSGAPISTDDIPF